MLPGRLSARLIHLLRDSPAVVLLGPRQAGKPPVRDSGIAHALLGIRDKEALLSHPVVGQTWESFIIETLIATAPDRTEAHHYRTSKGTEVDLVLRST